MRNNTPILDLMRRKHLPRPHLVNQGIISNLPTPWITLPIELCLDRPKQASCAFPTYPTWSDWAAGLVSPDPLPHQRLSTLGGIFSSAASHSHAGAACCLRNDNVRPEFDRKVTRWPEPTVARARIKHHSRPFCIFTRSPDLARLHYSYCYHCRMQLPCCAHPAILFGRAYGEAHYELSAGSARSSPFA